MTSQSHPSHAAGGVRWRGGRRVAVRRHEQLGVSSSEEQKTFHKASRWGLLREHKHGRSRLHNNRLHQTCRQVNQFEHVCVEKCPLTTRHTAKRSGDSCGGGRPSRKPDHGKTQRRKLRERLSPERSHDRIHTSVNPLGNTRPQRERTGEDSDMK